jgi:hypothetical protein
LWNWDGWGFVGFLVTLLATVFAALLPYQHRQLLDQLDDPIDRARIRARLADDPGVAHRFRDSIDGLIIRIDDYFGPSLRWPAFDRCLLHAFLYPYLLFIVAWSAGGTGHLGTIELLLPVDKWERLWRAAAMVIVVSWIISFVNLAWIESKICAFIRPLLQSLSAAVGRSVLWAERSTAVTIGIVIPFIAAIAVADRSGSGIGIAFSLCVALPIALATTRAYAVAGPGCVALAIVFIGLGTFLGDLDAAVTVATLFLILPVANALVDWLSWAVTRRLLRRSSDGAGATGAAINIAARLATDLGLAFMSLCGLAMLLPNTIEATNRLLVWLDWPPVPWLPLVNMALDAPFTAGFFVTGMLLTTLVPTLLHVVAGLFGIFAVWTWGSKRIAALIPPDRDAEIVTSDRQRVAWYLLRRRLWLLPATIATVLLVVPLASLLSCFIGPIGLFLADLSLCSTSWSHGLCPFWN